MNLIVACTHSVLFVNQASKIILGKCNRMLLLDLLYTAKFVSLTQSRHIDCERMKLHGTSTIVQGRRLNVIERLTLVIPDQWKRL